MSRERVDVLIAGAGPVGLLLAAELRRRGRSCIVLEKNAAPSEHSKALAIMPKTLQLFEQSGIAAGVLAELNQVRSVRFVTPRTFAHVSFGHLRTPHPFVGILAQSRTERILAAHARELGADLRYGQSLESFSQERGGVEARVHGGGQSALVQAAYIAGCDGAHSTVRRECGIPFDGDSYHEGAVLADVSVCTAVPFDEARVHVQRWGMMTLFPIAGSVRRIVVVDRGGAVPAEPDAAWLQARADAAGLPVRIEDEPLWSSAFRVHRRLARRFLSGNAVLAGDAAHVHSPVGGQGMNAGLRDAYDLAAALDAALHGDAAALARYGLQRRRAARRMLRSTDVLTRALVHPHPVLHVGREYLAPYVMGVPLLRDRVLRSLLTA